MQLRGIDFGHVMNASGARNFFGQGYWFHHWLQPFGLSFNNATFVAKTTPLDPRKGYMLTKNDDGMTPKKLFPDCIVIDHLKQTVLNAVGLTSPGAKALLACGLWQAIKYPFFVSFAAISDSVESRLNEYKAFVALIKPHLRYFKAPIGLEINLVCPNKEHVSMPTVEEVWEALNILSGLGIPLMPKYNLSLSYDEAMVLSRHPYFHALCLSNTILFGQMPHAIDWKGLFGTEISPLKKYGGGGLSATPLFPLVTEWIRQARNWGFRKPIVGCGGIMRWQDGCRMLDVGADAIQIGSVGILRPWRVRGIIARVNAHAQIKFQI